MKKKLLMSCVIMMSTSVLLAQTPNKQTTVRIKKVENINGVEKITDTTFTTNDPSSIKLDETDLKIEELSQDKNGNFIKKISINESSNTADGTKTEKELDAEIEKMLKEENLNGNTQMTKKVIIVTKDEESISGDKSEKAGTKIIKKRIEIVSADEADTKRISKQSGETDGKLNVEKINLYPNPNNGKFNLSFELSEKGNTKVSILDIDGKKVYDESLTNFSGKYNKEVDLSKHAKGIYFVRVEQGKHALIKKIILE